MKIPKSIHKIMNTCKTNTPCMFLYLTLIQSGIYKLILIILSIVTFIKLPEVALVIMMTAFFLTLATLIGMILYSIYSFFSLNWKQAKSIAINNRNVITQEQLELGI